MAKLFHFDVPAKTELNGWKGLQRIKIIAKIFYGVFVCSMNSGMEYFGCSNRNGTESTTIVKMQLHVIKSSHVLFNYQITLSSHDQLIEEDTLVVWK